MYDGDLHNVSLYHIRCEAEFAYISILKDYYFHMFKKYNTMVKLLHLEEI